MKIEQVREALTMAEQLTEITDQLLISAVNLTATVYLMVGDREEVYRALADRMVNEDFLQNTANLLGDDPDQFFRQVAIYAKDTAEEICKEWTGA
jgi:hypothetical protein